MTADPKTIWKRRAVLMAVIALLVAVPVTLLVRSEDDGGSAEPAIQVPPLGETKFERGLGVKLKLPRGWRKKTDREVLELRSRDDGTRIAISAPGPAGDAGQLFEQTLAELSTSYKSFKLLRELKKARLGGLRARVATAEAVQGSRGGVSRLLISTAPGDQVAYLVVVATSGSDSGRSLVEAQALLNRLKLTG